MSVAPIFGGFGSGGTPGGGGNGGGVDFFGADFATRPWFGTQNWGSAIYHAGQNRTYECWTAHYGPPIVRVRYYDHGTEEWSDPVTVATITGEGAADGDSDHRTPTIGIDADGYLYIAFGAHTSDLQWAISDSPHDISAWTEQTLISGRITYPHWSLVGTTMCLFYRGSTDVDEWNYSVRTGTPSSGSLTLGSPIELIDFADADRPYVTEVRPDGDGGVLFAFSRLTDGGGGRKHVYFARYIVSTGALENLDGSTSTASGSLPINTTLADSDYREFESTGDNVTGNPSWCWDSDGDLHVAFFDSEAGGDLDIKHMVYSGSPASWSTPSTVATVKDGLVGDYLQMFSLVPGASGKVELWYPVSASAQDGGDMTRRVRSAAGTWGSAETMVAETDRPLGVVQSVQNGHADYRVIFSEITQSQSQHYDERALMKRYHHGDSGFVQVPEYTDPYWHDVVWQSDWSDAIEDQSIRAMALTAQGNAAISGDRLVLDGGGDYVEGISGQGLTFDGEFCVELFGMKVDDNTAASTFYSRFKGEGDEKSIFVAYRGDADPDVIRVNLSLDGSANNLFEHEVTLDTSTEYNIVVSRDDEDKVRVHFGAVGGDLSMVASGTLSGALHNAAGVTPKVGARDDGNNQEHDGTQHGLRITNGSARDYATDSDVTPASIPLGTGDGSG